MILYKKIWIYIILIFLLGCTIPTEKEEVINFNPNVNINNTIIADYEKLENIYEEQNKNLIRVAQALEKLYDLKELELNYFIKEGDCSLICDEKSHGGYYLYIYSSNKCICYNNFQKVIHEEII